MDRFIGKLVKAVLTASGAQLKQGVGMSCEPEIRYHFSAARSLENARREREVQHDEGEHVERRTELYTPAGGADGRWRAANAKLGQAGVTKLDMGALNPIWV